MLSFWMTNHSQKRVASSSSHVMIYLLDDEKILYRSKVKSIGTRLPRILCIKETFRMSNTVQSLTILVSTVPHAPQPISDKSKLLESCEIISKSIIPLEFNCLHIKSYRASLVSVGCISEEKIGSVQLTAMRSDCCNQHMEVEVVDLRGATPSATEFLHWNAAESPETKDCVLKSSVIHGNKNTSIERDEKETSPSIFTANRTSNGISDHPKSEGEIVDRNESLPTSVTVNEAKYEPSLDSDSKEQEECECLKKREVDRPDEVSFASWRQEGKCNEDDIVSVTNDYKDSFQIGNQPSQKKYSITGDHHPLLKQSEGKDDDDSVESLRIDPSRFDGNKSIAQEEKSLDIEKECFSREIVEDGSASLLPAFKGLRVISKDMSISSEDSIPLRRSKRKTSLESHLTHDSSSSSSFYSFDGLRRTFSISNKRMDGAHKFTGRKILSPSLSSSSSNDSISFNSYLLHGEKFRKYEDDDSILSDTS
ncbi:predicted protein [Chaetoceros tenuissimus]|uniref:Uncharacterized protein n=1 Tax=Chaetoceros tenuissimus TaxID=426638 RepID=A0AAD3H0V3_9STRA|nr:predicted protein [Chaetoceros tenuissimus]